METCRIRRICSRLHCGAIASSVLLLSACVGLADIERAQDFMELYSRGDYRAAAQTLGGETTLDYDERNLLTSLQVGSALRAAGGLVESQAAFDRAESRLLWKSDAITSVDELLAAGFTLVTTDLARPYQGNIYDGVLVNTFKAMNAIHMGDIDRARIELNRAEQRQTNAVEQLAAKIRALGEGDAEDEATRNAESAQIDGAIADALEPDGAVAKRLAAVEALGEYRNLRNPFTDWLHGVFRLATGEANRASNLFRDAAALDGRNNQYVLADFLQAEAAAGSTAEAPARVWIVHEDGIGPYLNEYRLEFPVLTLDGVIIAGIALPEFVEGSAALGGLTISADGRHYRTEPLLSVDRYAATEFRAGHDAIVAKAVGSAIVRTIAQAIAQREARDQGGLFAVVASVGTTIAATALNRADTRIWQALPHTITVASVPRPSDDRLLIAAPNGQTIYDDTLPPGRFVLIAVKTVQSQATPVVHVAAFGE